MAAFLEANDLENEIYLLMLFTQLVTRTGDVIDVKSAEKTISDDHFHGSGQPHLVVCNGSVADGHLNSSVTSSGGLLHNNNDLNRLNCPMDQQNLINICVFEQ